MSGIVILIIIVGSAIGVFTIFLVRGFVNPRRMEGLAEAMKNGRYPFVIRRAKQFLARDARNVDAHYLLGQAYQADGKPELALMEYKIINQIGQFTALCREVPFRRQAATLFRRFNQHEEALKEYVLLIKKEPQVGEHYYNAGELFEERQMSDKAFAYYRKAVELDKTHAKGHLHLGMLLARQKKPLEARAELEISLDLEPENYQAHYHMGRLLKEMHDYAGALKSLEKAQRDPEYKLRALVETGTCYMSMNNLERAITTLERAISLVTDPDNPEALYSRYFLSLCYERTRKLDNAIEHWEYIYAKKPTFRDVAQKLSQYQDLRSDDRMKDYLTSTNEEFQEICTKVVHALNLEVRDVAEIKNGLRINSIEASKDWRSARRLPRVLLFLRDSEAVEETTVRGLHELMKKNNINRGIIVTSASFSRKAIDFAQTRPIDLLSKEKLSTLLKKTEHKG